MILIQNAHIMPIVGPELPNGCLLAEDGRITAVAPPHRRPGGLHRHRRRRPSADPRLRGGPLSHRSGQ